MTFTELVFWSAGVEMGMFKRLIGDTSRENEKRKTEEKQSVQLIFFYKDLRNEMAAGRSIYQKRVFFKKYFHI